MNMLDPRNTISGYLGDLFVPIQTIIASVTRKERLETTGFI
jgi:hypothetical protein